MANSGSGRRSGNANNRPGGSGRPGTAAKPQGAGGNGGGRSRQSADERARERLAEQRSGNRRGGSTGRPGQRPANSGGRGRPQQRSSAKTAGIFGSVFVVLAVVVIVLISTLGGSGGGGSTQFVHTVTAPPNIVNGVANVSPSELDTAGAGGGQVVFLGARGGGDPVVKLTGALQKRDGRPEIVYLGAEYCPFCAATRWALAIALDKFGVLHGLKITASSAYDFAPETHTLSFDGATYSSPYLSFTEVEQVTNQCKSTSPNPAPPPARECTGGYTLLQPTPKYVQALVTKYDTSPYFPSKNAGGIPFVYMAGKFVEDGAPYPSTETSYPPISLAGMDWTQIVATFGVPNSGTQGQALLGAANHYIAAFCQLTNGKPGNVCSMSAVKSIVKNGLK